MNDCQALMVEHISYAFGKTKALDDICFSVSPGQCSMLLGPNGAGKTTLFSLITRLYDSHTGAIKINGFDIKKQTRHALAQLGVVFQQPTLDLDLSVIQNLKYHASLHGLSRKQAKLRIQQELERQQMFDRRFEKVRQLNGGHRRRVEIARALLHQPSVLLLDEPTVGLDVPSRRSIVDYVHNLSSVQGIAVLWATHLIDEVQDNDRLIILHRGKIRAQGGLDQIKKLAETDNINDAFNVLTQDRMAA